MKRREQNIRNSCNLILRPLPALAIGLSVAFSALADTTAVTVSSSSQIAGGSPVALNFPLLRGGDVGYDTVLNYHTVDGSAIAGIDYTEAAAASITIPAGSTSGVVPITIAANTYGKVDQTFQLVLDSVTGIGQTPSFTEQQAFAAGTTPYAVVAVDLNADGKPDLVVANGGDSNVSVLLNTTATGAATANFAAQQTFTTGSTPISLAVADINHDGKPDLIVANYASNTVSVLLNTTVPGATAFSFSIQQIFATGAGPHHVVAADVNGDGRADLIVSNAGSFGHTVSVLINTTVPGALTASFADQQTFDTGRLPVSVTAEDLNGDGMPDLITANLFDNTLSVLLNTTAPGAATPSFAAEQTFAAGQGANSVTAADVNGDGSPDLIAANETDGSVSVLLNTTTPGDSTANFSAQHPFAAGSGASSVVAADVNGDGKSDLVVTSAGAGGDSVSILINTTAPGATAPRFAAAENFATASTPVSAAIADINGDGKPDLAVAGDGGKTVSVRLNSTALGAVVPGFSPQQVFATGTDPYFVSAADLNGDGKPDMIVVNKNDGTVSVWVDTAAPGVAAPSFAAPQTITTGSFPTCVAMADLNGDGRPDLIIADYNSQAILALLNTTIPGATTLGFAAPQAFATELNPSFLVLADVNGDGRPDVVATNYSSNTVSVLLNTTSPGATTPSFAAQHHFATGVSPFSLSTADINKDGKPDVIVTNLNDNTLSVLLNTTVPGAITPSFATQQTFATGNGPLSVAAADMNGDGKPDLIETNLFDHTVSVLVSTTPPGATLASFASLQTFAAGSSPATVLAVDMNGDGKPDLVVAGRGNTVSALYNKSAAGSSTLSFSPYQSSPAGLAPESVAAADLNGDGKPDLMVANLGDNTVSVLFNTQYQAVFTGTPATGTIHHDYIFASEFE